MAAREHNIQHWRRRGNYDSLGGRSDRELEVESQTLIDQEFNVVLLDRGKTFLHDRERVGPWSQLRHDV